MPAIPSEAPQVSGGCCCGFFTEPLQVSPEFGDTAVWPGDTFGISTLSPTDVVLGWGSATSSSKDKSDIFATSITVQLH